MSNKFNKKKILQASCFTLAAALLAPTVSAEVSGYVGASSDYRFRGVSQSAGKPALQAGIDYSADNGFFAGAWASTIDFDKGLGADDATGADVELDVFAGYAGSLGDNIEYDFTIYQYLYPGDDISQDYRDYTLGIYVSDFHFAYWYANDYGNGGDDYSYFETNYSHELSENWSLDLHAGYNFGDALEDIEYVDYSVGVSTSVSGVDVSIAWLGSNIDSDEEVKKDAFKSSDTLWISAIYNF